MVVEDLAEAKGVLNNTYLALAGTYETDYVCQRFDVGEGVSMLEAGCGSGKLGMYFALQGCSVELLDIDPEMLERAQMLMDIVEVLTRRELEVVFRCGSILSLPYAEDAFDVVFNEGVNEHFLGTNRQVVFDEMVRVAKRFVAVTVPNKECREQRERSEETIHQYKGMPDREKPFTKQELRKRLTDAGVQDIEIREIVENTGLPFRLHGSGYV